MTTSAALLAGETADESVIPFVDLPVYEAAGAVLPDLDVIVGGVLELRERLAAGRLDFEARYDIAADLSEALDRLYVFALTVRA